MVPVGNGLSSGGVKPYLGWAEIAPFRWNMTRSAMADINQYVDKAHEQKGFDELAKLPIDALQGEAQRMRRP